MASMLKGFEDLLIEKAKAGELPRPARRVGPAGVAGAESEDTGGHGGSRSYGGSFGGGSFGGGGGNGGGPADDFGAGYGTDNRRGGGYQRSGYQSRDQGRQDGGGGGGGGGSYEEPGGFEQSVGAAH